MRLIAFSDENFLPVVQNLVSSLDKIYPHAPLTYYMVGFHRKNCLQSENLKISYKTFFPKPGLPNLNFLKPSILLQSLMDHDEDIFIFLDSDITIGKRFSPESILRKSLEFPLASFGPYELPYTFRTSEGGITETYTPDLLMDYFGVKSKSMRYVQNCLIAYHRNHQNFLLEWESICLNKYLLKEHWRYFSFQDETAFNMLLWKYSATENLGHIFVNTHKFSTFRLIEERENLSRINIDDNPYEFCDESSKIMFYHGTKDQDQNLEIQKYIYENYTGNSGTSPHTT